MTVFKPGDRVFHAATIRNGTIETHPSLDGFCYVNFDGDPYPEVRLVSHLTPLGEPMATPTTALTAAIETILRHPDGPASDASIYDRNEDRPEHSIIIEGHVELEQLADEILKYQAGAPIDAAAQALSMLTKAFPDAVPSGVARAIQALDEHAQVVAIDAEKAELTKRRGELASKLLTNDTVPCIGAPGPNTPIGKAIDMIIKLQDQVKL